MEVSSCRLFSHLRGAGETPEVKPELHPRHYLQRHGWGVVVVERTWAGLEAALAKGHTVAGPTGQASL